MSDIFENKKNEFKQRKHPAHFPIVHKHNRPNIIFLTVCSNKRKRIFDRNEIFKLIVDSWTSADYWIVGKFMIMPDHIHLFCANANCKFPDLKNWVSYWKRIISKSWPYKEEYPIWQQDFWDRQLRAVDHYGRKWEYLKNNPVDYGLVSHSDDWPYQGELNILHW